MNRRSFTTICAPRTGRGKPRRNYIQAITRESISALIAAIGADRKIAVKTHSGFKNEIFPWLEELQTKR